MESTRRAPQEVRGVACCHDTVVISLLFSDLVTMVKAIANRLQVRNMDVIVVIPAG